MAFTMLRKPNYYKVLGLAIGFKAMALAECSKETDRIVGKSNGFTNAKVDQARKEPKQKREMLTEEKIV